MRCRRWKRGRWNGENRGCAHRRRRQLLDRGTDDLPPSSDRSSASTKRVAAPPPKVVVSSRRSSKSTTTEWPAIASTISQIIKKRWNGRGPYVTSSSSGLVRALWSFRWRSGCSSRPVTRERRQRRPSGGGGRTTQHHKHQNPFRILQVKSFI